MADYLLLPRQELPKVIVKHAPPFQFVGYEEDEVTQRVIDPALVYNFYLSSTDGDVVISHTSAEDVVVPASPDEYSVTVTLTPAEWESLRGKNFRGRLTYIDLVGDELVIAIFGGGVLLWP